MTSEDAELRNIELHFPLMRNMSRSDSECRQEDRIMTDTGTMVVAVHGDRNKPAIFTYHDIGLNHVTNFLAFFNHPDTRVLMQSFCVYHINAPGQEEDSTTLPTAFTFPTMDMLAEMILAVMEHYGIKHFIGMGVGAGANILSRFALQHPHCVDGLFLINCTSTAAGWTEWGYQKLNTMHLRSSGMTSSTQEYLMWHHFGKTVENRSYDLMQEFRQYFSKFNPYNLALFIDSFIRRTDLQIVRETDPSKKTSVRNFRCHVLLMSGAFSPHLEDTVIMNSRLDPTNSTWMKLSDCGMPLEERPHKVCEALYLFLQGLGHAVNQYRRRSSAASTSNEAFKVLQEYQNSLSKSLDEQSNQLPSTAVTTTTYNPRQEVHIVENPINQHTCP
ncbi:protein NDRG3-like [Stegodyphus dumicola]|uniref:protein NDRG3-like n=1 Tax=Stegodyphus dumicola TaxID=202533 RepID=UPI0015A9FCB7|nr:protein NDRG3-like [Stegodyphus dumicola]